MKINRREFVAGVGASTVVLALPASGLAKAFPSISDLPVNGMSLVQEAFNTVEHLGYDFEETARIFGYSSDYVSSMEELRGLVFEEAFDFGSHDIWTRVEYITKIRRLLEERVGTSAMVQIYCLRRTPLSSYEDFYVRFGRGGLQDLLYVTRILPYYLPPRLGA